MTGRFVIAIALYMLVALSVIALCFAVPGCMAGPARNASAK